MEKDPIEEEEGGFHMLEIHAPTAGAAVGGLLLTLVVAFLILYCCLKYRKGLARRIQHAANNQANAGPSLPLYNPQPMQHIYQTLPPPPSIPVPPTPAYATYSGSYSPRPMSPIPLLPPMTPTPVATAPQTTYPMLTYKVPDGV